MSYNQQIADRIHRLLKEENVNFYERKCLEACVLWWKIKCV